MFNNTSIVYSIGLLLDPAPPVQAHRQRVQSDPCLPERLPSTGFLRREAEQGASNAILKQLRRSPTPPTPDATDRSPRLERSSSVSSSSSSSSPTRSIFKKTAAYAKPWKDPQPFEIFSAVERKDVMYLMEVRDRAFPLLLRKTGNATPLLHAMRIGESHKDVAIILLGAFSRWINHLEGDEIALPKTRLVLKALRTNLKLAIDYGLAKSQSDLTASFLQTLIMSEGDKWVATQASNIGLALRAGTAGQPVLTAQSAVRKFATKELGKAETIAALEDYIANATADLLMMGAWMSALDFIQGELLPPYYFARDDRIYREFVGRLDKHQSAIQKSVSRRLKWQLHVLRNVLGGRTMTWHSKVDLLAGELDQGDGV